MSRLDAARHGASGRQILTLPLLAARLAGGFITPAAQDTLYPAVRKALGMGGFDDIAGVASLPGMPHAVISSLRDWWSAGMVSGNNPSPRLRDFLLLERRIRDVLPCGVLMPPDLLQAALKRVALAPRLLGSVTLDGIVTVDPIWHPLIDALIGTVRVRWVSPNRSARDWFKGEVELYPPTAAALQSADICADPRSEAREALRWARALIVEGKAAPHQIAIVAASSSPWDDAFLVLSREADLPIHFPHGIPALASREGQTCAALADILLRGLTQERLRLLIARLPRRPLRDLIPSDWARGLRRRAALRSPDLWRHALQLSRPERASGDAVDRVLLPLITELAKGVDAAEAMGNQLLSGPALTLWQNALRMAPAQALELSLQALRVDDGRDPGNSIVWSPAELASSACRPFVRLIGLTANAWPRRAREDPLLPAGVLGSIRLSSSEMTNRDNQLFEVLVSQSTLYSLSRNHRNAAGSLQAPSSLWPRDRERVIGRSAIPDHAFSESDRLYARPKDAGKDLQVLASRACWHSWQDGEHHTPHDGLIRADHPLVLDALAQIQSTTSLQRLLCDPLGFVWQYALHWREANLEVEPLGLDPRAFGELVHALVNGVLRRSSPRNPEEIEIAIAEEANLLRESWPTARAVPPGLLWRHTVTMASKRATNALLDGVGKARGRIWTELPFGEPMEGEHPWSSLEPVAIAGTGLRFRGRLDRLDHNLATGAAVITDYKVGKAPEKKVPPVFSRGTELQRVFYAIAVNTLVPELRSIVAGLTYLKDEPARTLSISDDTLQKAMGLALSYSAAGEKLQREGQTAPGPEPEYPDFLAIGLPADREAYRRAKRRAFVSVNAPLEKLWASP